MIDRESLRDPHNVRVDKHRHYSWNGIAVHSVEFLCAPGKVWHNITNSQTSVYIILDQIGGRCEPRIKRDQPCRSDVSGPQYIDFVPAGMSLWGYSDGIRRSKIAECRIDFKKIESTLGENIDLSQLELPRLRFYDERIIKIGALLAEECESPGANNGLYGDSLTIALVINLLRLGKEQSRVGSRGILSPGKLNMAIEYMGAHLSENVRLSELAQLTNLSQSQFGRAFKAAMGVAPHRWQLNARIARAQQLMLDGDISLAEVALATGFSAQSHFTRIFRQMIGCSPGSWKRIQRR